MDDRLPTIPGGSLPSFEDEFPEEFHDDEARGGSSLPPAHPVVREIGRGGMARILLVEDLSFGRRVAMKVALPRCARDPALLRRFVNEVRITGRLDHPAIPPAHTAGTAPDGTPFMTLKWVQGRTLAEILLDILDPAVPGAPAMTLRALLDAFLKVCEGVAFAHERGVVHRDLKPENIMVGRFGEVYVMDWGLAKQTRPDPSAPETPRPAEPGDPPPDRPPTLEAGPTEPGSQDPLLSTDGTILGTPTYMAPEQAQGRIDLLDERTDVYALGAILYEILTLEHPFEAETTAGVLLQVAAGALEPPRQRAPKRRVPRELESVCLKAMAFERAARYPSVNALAAELRAFLERRPVAAHRYGPLERLSRWVQRHPAASVGAAVAALLLAVGAGVTAFMIQRERLLAMEALESRRARLAAEAEAHRADDRADSAKARADRAHALLEKGRRVSQVLRAAKAELGAVLAVLQSSHHSGRPLADKQAVGDAQWPAVEAFRARTPCDGSSQAAALAVAGWLRWLAGFEAEGLAFFRMGRDADPEVPYGALFEAMVWLARYFESQQMPLLRADGERHAFGTVPAETPAMGRARANLEAALAGVSPSMVWGESAVEDFRAVLEGFAAIQKGDLEGAENGLTRALAIQEMAFLECAVLLARAKVRLLRGRLDEALADGEAVLRACPDSIEAVFLLASVHCCRGLRAAEEKQDPRAAYTAALEAFDEALRLRPQSAWILNARGMTRLLRALAARTRGTDARDDLDGALDDFTRALDREPGDFITRNNRAKALLTLGEEEERKGRDPRPHYERAVEDCDRVLQARPDFRITVSHRREACKRMALAEGIRNRDPRDWFRKALESADAALALDPENVECLAERGLVRLQYGNLLAMARMGGLEVLEGAVDDFDAVLERRAGHLAALHNRGLAYKTLGDARHARGEDPCTCYAKALADLDETIRRDPSSFSAFMNRGLARNARGTVRAARGEDARGDFEKAVEDLEGAARLEPHNAGTWNHLGLAIRDRAAAEAKAGGDGAPWFERAIKAFEAAVEKSPSLWHSQANLAITLEDLGRLEEALAALEEAALRAGPQRSRLEAHLARIREKLGRK